MLQAVFNNYNILSNAMSNKPKIRCYFLGRLLVIVSRMYHITRFLCLSHQGINPCLPHSQYSAWSTAGPSVITQVICALMSGGNKHTDAFPSTPPKNIFRGRFQINLFPWSLNSCWLKCPLTAYSTSSFLPLDQWVLAGRDCSGETEGRRVGWGRGQNKWRVGAPLAHRPFTVGQSSSVWSSCFPTL